MPKCPKCGSELQSVGDSLQCPDCGSKFKTQKKPQEQATEAVGETPRPQKEVSESEKIRVLEARLAALEAEKQAKQDKPQTPLKNVFAKDGKLVMFFKKYWLYLLVGVLLFVTFLTLMITLVGLRGIYVNVNNANDFYDFDVTSYRASSIDFLTGKEELEEGKWKLDGNKLTLTIKDEFFGEISDDFDFVQLDGFKRIKIDDDEYKRVSLVGLKTTQKKVKITFDPQNGQAPLVYNVKIGSVFKDEIPEVSEEQYLFEGWFDQPTHDGERCNIEGQRVWEDMDFYAVWHTEHYASAYRHDENYHWQICEFAHCDERVPNSYGSHSFKWQTVKESTCTEYGQQDYACVTCGYTIDTRQLELKPHEMSDWKIDGDFPCTQTRHRDCANCDYREIDDSYDNRTPHNFDPVTKKCTICKSNDFLMGDTLNFGEYPQTKVTDNGISATLAQMSGSRPVKGNRGKWMDYKYYINGKSDEYMWYIDLDYNGARYRGVYFTSYRPYWTTDNSSTYQDDNGYYINTLYWFKWEPIEWRVLERTNSEVFLMSNVILDSQQYYHDYETRTISGKTIYPNNYKESDIRAWLNGTFYDQAFDSVEQSIIKTTLVDNSYGYEYACENTNDKVFLLSYNDVLNTSYGFNSSSYNYDTARRLKTTGYAQSQGAYTSTDSSYRGNGWWWLRSPVSSDGINALNVYNYGNAVSNYFVCYTRGGVVPALRITLY